MPKIYALLVGIDVFAAPDVSDLSGCVNDIELAERVLRDRFDVVTEKLCNEQATRRAIIDRFRGHLGAAGAGDIALFWFSGHGSTGPLPPEIWYAESAAACQTTVCHDSRAGAPDLYDKELAVLAREVVAGGAQLVTIMDSCHSRSGVRGPEATALPPRLAPALTAAPALRDLLPELAEAVGDQTRPLPGTQLSGHIAISACDEYEVANEDHFAGGVHGIFSEALANALTMLAPGASYRQVVSEARCRVEGRYRRQRPGWEAVGDLADREFLGGALRPRPAQITLRHPRSIWEIDAGAVHGIGAGSRLAVHHEKPLHEVRVNEVFATRSVVEPLGWQPDPAREYDMVLTEVPMPPVAVDLPASAARLAPAIRLSPHLRVAEDPGVPLLLRVSAEDGTFQITSADHQPLAPPVAADEQGVRRTIRDLEHIARWTQVRNLANPSPALRDAVRLEFLPVRPDGTRPAQDARPLPRGNLEFQYTWTGSEWRPPAVHIRLRNTTGRKLYCVLLDLTDRFRMHADLFRGDFVAAHWTADVGRGNPIGLSLPPDRKPEPGASVTDWLVLLVSEEPFSSEPFALPGLGELPRGGTRGRPGITGVLDRLGLLAVSRDVVPPPDRVVDWTVRVVEITTRVPNDGPPHP
jgi:hypothetical protein